MREGLIPYFGFDLPNCMWPNDGYDPQQSDSNLFRNPALLMVFKHIFTSPTSAVKELPGQAKTRKPQARINGMESVTAGSIAYAAVMFRYAITSSDDWRQDEKVFYFSEFFRSVMSFFDEEDEDFDAEWVTDLVEYYNVYVLTHILCPY
ncbi:hypothetical protein CPC08DRAFT_643207 [Agrocybe pediades]|nr:hypothetical protein CPC08DRAFT_643207 [Agrocybe pediades]